MGALIISSLGQLTLTFIIDIKAHILWGSVLYDIIRSLMLNVSISLRTLSRADLFRTYHPFTQIERINLLLFISSSWHFISTRYLKNKCQALFPATAERNFICLLNQTQNDGSIWRHNPIWASGPHGYWCYDCEKINKASVQIYEMETYILQINFDLSWWIWILPLNFYLLSAEVWDWGSIL